MMRRALLMGCLALGVPCAAHAGSMCGSVLALPALGPGDAPELTVLQRTIMREWGPSDDSTYVTVEVPNYKSEGWAAVMSAIVPGAGQAYLGEKSAILFALAEIAGWTARAVFDNKSDQQEAAAAQIAGAPTDTSSAWSASRWQASTGGDPTTIVALYSADPDAYFEAIEQPQYAPGWRNDGGIAQAQFSGAYNDSETYDRKAQYAEGFLWLNHAFAAFDALRAARLHNVPLQQGIDLKLKSGWRHGQPTLRATLVKRF